MKPCFNFFMATTLAGLSLIAGGCDPRNDPADTGAVPPPGHSPTTHSPTHSPPTHPHPARARAGSRRPAARRAASFRMRPARRLAGKPTRSPIILAEFQATTPAGQARVTFTSLPEKGGDLLANINRWRAQLTLPPVESLADVVQRPLTLCGNDGVWVDLSNPANAQRFLVATATFDGRGWYLKMIGTADQLGPGPSRVPRLCKLPAHRIPPRIIPPPLRAARPRQHH